MIAPLPFQWPLTVIDFEASSLAADSYPIEIGVARWHSPADQIAVWSRRIQPTDEWLKRSAWSADSQRVHGIHPKDLLHGYEPFEVMELLNERCPVGAIAYCDGAKHDQHWLTTLAAAAPAPVALVLGSWRQLVSSLDPNARGRFADWSNSHPPAHRAAWDAIGHLQALAFALDLPKPKIIPWDGDV